MRKDTIRRTSRLGSRLRSPRGFQGTKNIDFAIAVNNDPVNNVNNIQANSTNDVNRTKDSANNGCVNSSESDPNHTEPSPHSKQPQLPAISTPRASKSSKTSSKTVRLDKLVNKSKEKLKNSSLKPRKAKLGRTRSSTRKLQYDSMSTLRQASCYKIISSNLLSNAILSSAICSKCCNEMSILELFEIPKSRKGLCKTLVLRCTVCNARTEFQTSARATKFRAYDINIRSVYASQTMGRAGLSKFCGLLDLPQPVRKSPYHKIQNVLREKTLQITETLLQDASNRLKAKIALDEPEFITTNDDGTMTFNAGVTVDGTWMKRGHTSKTGIVFVVSVLTGEVLDYAVKSLFCHSCSLHKNRLSPEGFLEWYESHADECQVNHKSSSDQMETEGAKEIFLRSKDKFGIKYTSFVRDGDSRCFGAVKQACEEKFGNDYIITKEECSGHVQKRIGTRLRDYKKRKRGIKLDDGKTVGGRNRLTDQKIDKMQNFSGEAIRGNKGNLEGMENAVSAILNHMIRNDEEPSLDQQHRFCPTGSESWCKYWSSRDQYNENNRLLSVFYTELEPIFTALSDSTLLSRCLKGLTQNQNEALNGVLWSTCPKTKFAGCRKVVLSVCDCIKHFNTGAGAKLDVLDSLGITPGLNAVHSAEVIDSKRIKSAECKIAAKALISRRKRRSEKRKKEEKKKTTYFSGAFGLSQDPEIELDGPSEPKKAKKDPQ